VTSKPWCQNKNVGPIFFEPQKYERNKVNEIYQELDTLAMLQFWCEIIKKRFESKHRYITFLCLRHSLTRPRSQASAFWPNRKWNFQFRFSKLAQRGKNCFFHCDIHFIRFSYHIISVELELIKILDAICRPNTDFMQIWTNVR